MPPNLRVISGSARGRKLRSVPGDTTRPITDKVKEALFNIIRPELPDAAFLDLFAGTGSVGIEALSRGAGFVRFIDKLAVAVKTIEQNLAETGLSKNAEVLQGDAFRLLGRKPDRTFDYVFIAPPQYQGLWKEALAALDANPGWLVFDAWVIVQLDPKEIEPVSLVNLDEFDRRRYGNTTLIFYERKPESDEQ